MYSIEGRWRAFCFDNAVTSFGMALEAELDSIEGKNSKEINGKRSRVLAKWLDRPMKFREPQATSPSPTAGAAQSSGGQDV